MNVLHVNPSDLHGGAARAAFRLHEGLRRSGHTSRMCVRKRSADSPEVQTLDEMTTPFRRGRHRLMDRLAVKLHKRWGVAAFCHRNSWLLARTDAFREADVLHCHNLHGNYFNFRALSMLAMAKPTVWTLHDMWSFTGHCAYSYDCDRWRTGCHHCPLMAGAKRDLCQPPATVKDWSAAVWRAKRRVYRDIKLHAVTPSKWLRELAGASILGQGNTVECIPNGLDLGTFVPGNKQRARELLGLPDCRYVLFFSGFGLGRKGGEILREALCRLSNPQDICLLTSGEQWEGLDVPASVAMHHLGRLQCAKEQCQAFVASDLFVFPSLADNQPLVLIEALACGVPSVASDVGGIPEMVRPGETGVVVPAGDAQALADAVGRLLSDPEELERMGRRCREVAETEYSIDRQVGRYVECYERAVAARKES